MIATLFFSAFVAMMRVGVTCLTPAERDAFVKATRPVYGKWKPTVGADLVANEGRAGHCRAHEVMAAVTAAAPAAQPR